MLNEYKGYKIKYSKSFCIAQITISRNDGHNITIWKFEKSGIDANFSDQQLEDLAKRYIHAIITLGE